MDNNKYTDEQLKRALAKMLPEDIKINCWNNLVWVGREGYDVINTELLYLCDLLEQSLDEQQELKYDPKLYDLCYYKGIPQYRAPWQDRVIAAAEARNIIID